WDPSTSGIDINVTLSSTGAEVRTAPGGAAEPKWRGRRTAKRASRPRGAYDTLANQMRSSAARLTLGAAAWIALGIAAFLLFRSEQHLAGLTSALRTFDQHAHDASDALADLRASQQAYVAAGQGVAFWMPKVATTVGTVTTAIDALKESATAGARTALDEATATMTEFGNVDQRARE